MRKIKCYLCNGIFGINEKYRTKECKELKREHNDIAEKFVKVKIKQGICCPYCHQHLFEKLIKKE